MELGRRGAFSSPDNPWMTPPQLAIDGPIATLRLCRPAQANRLELDDLKAIRAHIDALNATPSVRVVLVRGEGKHFCSGFHIDTVPQVDAPALFEALCSAWESVEPITVAVLHGGVWGGATDLALACDFRLVAATRKWPSRPPAWACTTTLGACAGWSVVSVSDLPNACSWPHKPSTPRPWPRRTSWTSSTTTARDSGQAPSAGPNNWPASRLWRCAA